MKGEKISEKRKTKVEMLSVGSHAFELKGTEAMLSNG